MESASLQDMEEAADLSLKALESGGPPLAVFSLWLADAKAREINDPNAMNLATLDEDGKLSSRIVLLKSYDEKGFVFHTNLESRKGRALRVHPEAALCFHWKSLRRQIRIEGPASPISAALSDAYFAGRPRASQIGAWASQQSRPLASRETLMAAIETIEKRYEDQAIPRPPYWGGICVAPLLIEFWQERLHRLHDRIIFTRKTIDAPWQQDRQYP